MLTQLDYVAKAHLVDRLLQAESRRQGHELRRTRGRARRRSSNRWTGRRGGAGR